MKTVKTIGAVALIAALSACAGGQVRTADKSFDTNYGSKHKPLSQLIAGIWVAPNGCQHWIIDDGIEGYMSERLTPAGLPVCSGDQTPTTIVGPFKAGGDMQDPVRSENYSASGNPLPDLQ